VKTQFCLGDNFTDCGKLCFVSGHDFSRAIDDWKYVGLHRLRKKVADGVRFVPSLRDSPRTPSLPGTSVPGYRLFRPYGTASFARSGPNSV